MRILAIETSCDETAIAVLETVGSRTKPIFKLLSNQVLSQIKIHKPYGGVVPNLAKREHLRNLPILLKRALSGLNPKPQTLNPNINAIAVTYGPGLEPALWTGINFAKDLAKKWRVPLVAVNHLEGHIYASFLQETSEFPISNFQFPKFPLLALIVSGGHTELVLMKKHLDYKVLGETLDDAAGEAFDKVARMLGLGYPGGPEISKLAERQATPTPNGRSSDRSVGVNFPRPMINSKDFNFSFSGLKTAVLYYLRDNPRVNKALVAREFQQAVVDVLVAKTKKALEKYKPKSLVVGGGVAANQVLRRALYALIKNSFPAVSLHISPLWLCGDNAAMIAVAAYFKARARKFKKPEHIRAQGSLRLD